MGFTTWEVCLLILSLGYFDFDGEDTDDGDEQQDGNDREQDPDQPLGNSGDDLCDKVAGSALDPPSTSQAPAPAGARNAAPSTTTQETSAPGKGEAPSEGASPPTTAPARPGKAEGKWSKHSSARLIHAIHENQSALATIAVGKSRPQVDAGDNFWDVVGITWCHETSPHT